MQHAVLDLFAGTGVGVAIKQLGAKEYGVEIMPAAIATREANGMETVYNDVWDAHLAESLGFDTLWASPPCQSFSLAGKGAGRKALDDVLGIIERKQYLDIHELRAQSDLLGDDRTGLVLSPLHYAARFKPTYIALEQVPPVLPVWQAMKPELEGMGYSVWVGYIHAEQYGVPQTRKRAYLIARKDSVEAKPPVPTHSRYRKNAPPEERNWVSLEDALGRSGFTAEKVMGKGMVERYGSRPGRDSSEPAFTIRANAGGSEPGGFVLRELDPVWSDRPATTVVSSAVLAGPGRSEFVKGGVSRQDRPGSIKLSIEDSSKLQSYPDDFKWDAGARLQIGNAVPPLVAKAVLQELWGE